jgi:hypothetical protein
MYWPVDDSKHETTGGAHSNVRLARILYITKRKADWHASCTLLCQIGTHRVQYGVHSNVRLARILYITMRSTGAHSSTS